MPRKKLEFKALTEKRILEINPDRKFLNGEILQFKSILKKALRTTPFDKKKK